MAKMNWEAANTRDKLERPEWDHEYARRPKRQAPVRRSHQKKNLDEGVPFTAQFPGRCYICGVHISPGTKITFFPNRPRERRTCHQACEVSELRATRG